MRLLSIPTSSYPLLGASLLLGLVACQDPPKSPPKTQPDTTQESALPEPAKRDVFGIPLPPRVRALSKNEHYVWVETDMDIPKLERFYQDALVGQDYEVLRVNQTLRIVGLRPFMPMVKAAHIRGPRTYVRMVFTPSRSHEDDKQVAAKNPSDPNDINKPTKPNTASEIIDPATQRDGDPVMLKTSDGELLAPGAKWGEPYWPPKGSPLDTPAMKHNWGKPFGEWQTH